MNGEAVIAEVGSIWYGQPRFYDTSDYNIYRRSSKIPESVYGTYVAVGGDYEAFQWWDENCDTILNDERMRGVYGNRAVELALEYYPKYGDYGAWIELNIGDDSYSVTSEYGFSGHGIGGGEITWTGNHTGISSDGRTFKIIDYNTLEVDGQRYVRVY